MSSALHVQAAGVRAQGHRRKSEGPVVFDSNNNPWNPQKMIGNGSKIIVAFDIYAWKGNTGAGMTFNPGKSKSLTIWLMRLTRLRQLVPSLQFLAASLIATAYLMKRRDLRLKIEPRSKARPRSFMGQVRPYMPRNTRHG